MIDSKGDVVTIQQLIAFCGQGNAMPDESGYEIGLNELEELIAAYLDARSAWLDTAASSGELVADGGHFEAFEAAGRAIVYHPCRLPETVTRKIAFVLDTADLYSMVREDEDVSVDLLRVFLSSLIGETAEPGSRH